MAQKIGGGKNKPQKKNDFTVGMMIFFLAGCAAEVYLLAVRRFYVDGTAVQLVTWDEILRKLTLAGLAVLVLGGILLAVWRKNAGIKRMLAGLVLAVGGFLAVSGWIMRTFYPSGVSLACIVVPAVVVWGLLWKLYDRECVYALTILALTTLTLWICRHGLKNIYWGKWVLAGACCYMLLMVAVYLLGRRTEKSKGLLGTVRILPPGADYAVIYGCCGVSVLAVALALFSVTIAYYALWAMALLIFALAVYYTVKQL